MVAKSRELLVRTFKSITPPAGGGVSRCRAVIPNLPKSPILVLHLLQEGGPNPRLTGVGGPCVQLWHMMRFDILWQVRDGACINGCHHWKGTVDCSPQEPFNGPYPGDGVEICERGASRNSICLLQPACPVVSETPTP